MNIDFCYSASKNRVKKEISCFGLISSSQRFSIAHIISTHSIYTLNINIFLFILIAVETSLVPNFRVRIAVPQVCLRKTPDPNVKAYHSKKHFHHQWKVRADLCFTEPVIRGNNGGQSVIMDYIQVINRSLGPFMSDNNRCLAQRSRNMVFMWFLFICNLFFSSIT